MIHFGPLKQRQFYTLFRTNFGKNFRSLCKKHELDLNNTFENDSLPASSCFYRNTDEKMAQILSSRDASQSVSELQFLPKLKVRALEMHKS